jgi:hypothetical protein
MKKSSARHMTLADVATHQQRSFGAPRCTCKPVGAYHSPMCPVSLFQAAALDKNAITMPKLSRRGGKLRKHREPNQTEAEMGQIQEARRRRGEIVSAEFEAITLRWGDMEYTPDWFVIESQLPLSVVLNSDKATLNQMDRVFEGRGGTLVEIVYIEVKGGWKWEDSIIKFKAFRKAMPWARFEFWEKIDGRWNQAA